MQQTIETVEDVIKDWPKEPRESAMRLIEYYGEPDEHCASQLVWLRVRMGDFMCWIVGTTGWLFWRRGSSE